MPTSLLPFADALKKKPSCLTKDEAHNDGIFEIEKVLSYAYERCFRTVGTLNSLSALLQHRVRWTRPKIQCLSIWPIESIAVLVLLLVRRLESIPINTICVCELWRALVHKFSNCHDPLVLLPYHFCLFWPNSLFYHKVKHWQEVQTRQRFEIHFWFIVM